MKKVFLSLLSLILVAGTSFAQTSVTSADKMYKHSGDVLDVKIVRWEKQQLLINILAKMQNKQ